jgi:ATP-binding cassette subfamily B protein
MDDGEEIGKAYDGRLIRRLWTFVRPYRLVFWGALLLSPVNQAFSLVQPWLLMTGINGALRTVGQGGALPHGDAPVGPSLAFLSGLFAIAVVGEFASYYGQSYLTMLVAQRSLADLRVRLFGHLQRLPMAFYDRTPIGKVVSRVTTDVDVLNEMFAAGAMTIVLDLLKLAGITVFMCWINWRMAVVSLALLPPMTLAIDFFRRRARITYRQIRERIARINGFLQEAITGMAVIQLSAREARTYGEFERLNADHRDSNLWSNRYEASLFSLVEAVATVSIAAMLWRGGVLHAQGAIELGTVIAFIQFIQQFFVPIRDFSAKYAVMQSSMTAAERIFALIDEPEEPVVPDGRVPAEIRGAIEFDHVWFAYKTSPHGDPEWVLRDVSFRIAPGEEIAIVGATGSGKTTIIKLLDRLYEAQRGRILVDDIDVREWDPEALRRRIAVVLQDVFLLSGTVAENISLGRADIDRERMEASARHVNADGFIARLGGLDARLRERGSNLSTGQRQLLAFARALAHDPAILVMDEATSSVDAETEWLVQDALGKLLAGRTAVVIAHRLSTIEHADRILVLHKGVLREQGTHFELLAADGIYAKLYRVQYAAAGSSPPVPAAAGS